MPSGQVAAARSLASTFQLSLQVVPVRCRDRQCRRKAFTLPETANRAARRRIRASMNWLRPEHIVQSALHPTHILRTGWCGFGGRWLGFDRILLWHRSKRRPDHAPRAPSRIGREWRSAHRRFLRFYRERDRERSRPFGHDRRCTRRNTVPA